MDSEMDAQEMVLGEGDSSVFLEGESDRSDSISQLNESINKEED